ncbi:ABC transporter permease [Rhodococcus gannanensis]|uniref:ABC transporter permease n=1 Tax=Rhodococcus gannanensis TaxID=1960308 RepID=A0ABW4P055_9NOCA
MSTLVTSELRKVLTLRFWWALAIAPVVIAMFTGAIYGTVADGLELVDEANPEAAATAALMIAIMATSLAAAVFGAVNAGTEFRHHTFTPTFLTTRGRDSVLATKLGVTALFGLGYAIAVEIVTVACLLVFGGDSVEFTSEFLTLIPVAALVTALWALLGAGLGLLFASSTAASVTLLAWIPVGELIADTILHNVGGGALVGWLPGALTLSTLTFPVEIEWLPAWQAALLALIVWTAAICAFGWWRTRSRDIA